jgi:hypothetical protein
VRKLCAGNLSRSITRETIQWAFGVFGEVVAIRIITDRESGCPRGFGPLVYARPTPGRESEIAVSAAAYTPAGTDVSLSNV